MLSYPRMAVYSDFQGWQTLQFTSGAEFALNFGNFKVSITVPSDHIVAATGECQNYKNLLTGDQFVRWTKAQTAKEPVEVVTLDEALQASKQKSLESMQLALVFLLTDAKKFLIMDYKLSAVINYFL